MVKYELHLPIFSDQRRYRKRFCETFFPSEPEGLLCAFALIENKDNFNHIRTNFSKDILWPIGYKHSIQLRNSLHSPSVNIPCGYFSVWLPHHMYLRQVKLQIQSEHHIKLSFRYSVYSPLGSAVFQQHVVFLLQSNQAFGWSTEGAVYYFGPDLLA